MSETTTLLNGLANKLGNGAERIITDAEKFATEIVRRIDVIAPQIANEIKKIGLYAWQVLVKQQLAEGIFYLIAAIVIPITLYLWFKLFIKKVCVINGNYDDPADGGITIITIILCILTLIGSGAFLFYGITHIMSPEYWAVIELLEKINPPSQ